VRLAEGLENQSSIKESKMLEIVWRNPNKPAATSHSTNKDGTTSARPDFTLLILNPAPTLHTLSFANGKDVLPVAETLDLRNCTGKMEKTK
jgi:hypothetical protein